MNSLKQINFEFLLNNTETSKIIKSLSIQKKIDLLNRLREYECSYCKKELYYHARCFKCKERKCIVFDSDKCLECVKNEKFTILLKNTGMGYHHSISYKHYRYFIDKGGDNVELKNLTYDKVIEYLDKIFE